MSTSPPTHRPSLRELREFGTQLEREVLGGAVAMPSGRNFVSNEKLLLPQPPPGQWLVGRGGRLGHLGGKQGPLASCLLVYIYIYTLLLLLIAHPKFSKFSDDLRYR